MSRFNTPQRASTLRRNLAGGEAFQQSPKLELASILLTSFVQDQYYRTASDTTKRLQELITSSTSADFHKFAAKASIFARREFGMRSISHVAAATIAHTVKGKHWLRPFIRQTVTRPDDVTEILAFYFNKYGRKPFPHALEKGLADGLQRFDAYQLAKYRGEGKSVSLVDAFNILHPKPRNKEQAEAFAKLISGKLTSANKTWEAKLTQAGQQATSKEEKEGLKAQAWEQLLMDQKLGYFALLRNLRNIVEQAPHMVQEACKQLTNRDSIKRSLVLPFRFLTAYEELRPFHNHAAMRPVLMAISDAMELALDSTPSFDGLNLVACDVSGSMDGRPSQIASIFSAAICRKSEADLMIFGSSARYVQYDPRDRLAVTAELLKARNEGTDFHKIFQAAIKPYERIFIVSDEQGWVGYSNPSNDLREYRRRFAAYNCDPRIFSIDVAGYGTLQFPEHNVYALAGFSDKMFEIMQVLDQDRNALIKRIEAIVL